MLRRLVVLLVLPFFAIAGEGPIPVEIRGEKGNWQLYRGGEPYIVKGAGTQDVESLEALAAAGGNSIRTWSSDVGDLLDRAHELGITVSLCMDIERERLGFDYGDEAVVKAQFEKMRGEVLKYRDHPALLTWIIGNELNHDFEDPRVYDAVNEISKMIHELDPHHPTTSTTAGIDESLVQIIKERAPDLDFLSVQVYGALYVMPKVMREVSWEKPYMITEWGTIGHWESGYTAWRAPIEPTSSQKAGNYARGYREIIQDLEGIHVGQYVFLWGQKQERTPTWYGMFLPGGGRTEAIDVMHKTWTGEWPENRAPQVKTISMDGRRPGEPIVLSPGRTVSAKVGAKDPDKDELTYTWQLMRESTATEVGGDAEEIPEDLSHLIVSQKGKKVRVKAPMEAGAYRLFVYVRDNNNSGGHANVPFFVSK